MDERLSNRNATQGNGEGGNAIPDGEIETTPTSDEIEWMFWTGKLRSLKEWQIPGAYAEEKRRAQPLFEDCARKGLAQYNEQNETNFVLYKISAPKVIDLTAEQGYFHLNFIAEESIDDRKQSMFFAEAVGIEESVVSVCCKLDLVADNEGYHDDIHILPPVTKLEKPGQAIAHAVICAIESRFRKSRRCRYTRMFQCSVKSLIQTLSTHIYQTGNMWTYILSPGMRNYKPKPRKGYWSIALINDAISKVGIGLVIDEAKSSQHSEQVKNIRHVKLEEFRIREKPIFARNFNHFDDLAEEIQENGPVIALVGPFKHDFADWDSELAKHKVYSGCSSQADAFHVVTLIGASRFDNGRRYFIAQNCFGEEWGDNGVYRLMPEDCLEVFSPVLG